MTNHAYTCVCWEGRQRYTAFLRYGYLSVCKNTYMYIICICTTLRGWIKGTTLSLYCKPQGVLTVDPVYITKRPLKECPCPTFCAISYVSRIKVNLLHASKLVEHTRGVLRRTASSTTHVWCRKLCDIYALPKANIARWLCIDGCS